LPGADVLHPPRVLRPLSHVALRSILIDGDRRARIGEPVMQIEPLEDGRHAWVLATRYRSEWRVYLWALDDGTLLDLESGTGTGVGIAVGARRVFIEGTSNEIAWCDLGGGARGIVRIGDHEAFDRCTHDGRVLATQQRIDRRSELRNRLYGVDGDIRRSSIDVPAPIVFSDDSRHALHLSDDRSTIVRLALATDAADVLTPAPAHRWTGLCPIRGSARVIAWTTGQLVVADFDTGTVGPPIVVDNVETVDDACGDRAVITQPYPSPSMLFDLATRQPIATLATVHHRPATTFACGGARVLRQRGPLLDVIDATTGVPLALDLRGHQAFVRYVVWAPDGSVVATAADDGRIRVLRPGSGDVVEVRFEASSGFAVAFTPDARRLCAVTAAEVTIWDVATGAALRRFPSFGTHSHSAAVSADGTRLLAGSYGHGVRVFDLATGQVVVESDATESCSYVAFAGDDIVAFERQRRAGVRYAGHDPLELVRWTQLDARGELRGEGSWRFENASSGIELHLAPGAALVTWYGPGGHQLHVFDLREPSAAPHIVRIPAGAKLLDARAGRALFLEADELVLRVWSTGAELERVKPPRTPHTGGLSADGRRVAVAYVDQGVEVFEAS
jgi:WD40 domain-containing protein